jgi:Caspase domain
MSKVALLIGVSKYGAGIQALPAAPRDVAAMQEVLQNPEMGGFDEVKDLINPNHWEMQQEIELWFRDRAKDDLVLLFFSGHGLKDERGDLYFAACNTQKDERGELIKSTAVAASFVHSCIRDSKCKRQVVILDCCFSGAFGNLLARDDGSVDLERQLGAEGRVVLTSASAIQYSYEQKGAKLSIYTHYLVEGMTTGAADLDNDGAIAVQELHEYACGKVQETAPSMNPKIIVLKDEGFEIKLAKAPVADPKLKYRKEVERYANRGAISPVGRMILDTLRLQLGLSAEETGAIETQVLRPYQDRLENLQRYREAFLAASKLESPLGEETRKDLKRFRDILGLREADTELIEAAIAPPQTTTPPTQLPAEPPQQSTPKIASKPPPVQVSPKPSPVPPKSRPWIGAIAGGAIAITLALGLGYLAYTIIAFPGTSDNPVSTPEIVTSPTSNTPTPAREQCFAVVGVGETSGRIRSEPSSRGGEETKIVSASGEQFPVTGQQTESAGWIQLELPSGQEGWVHRDVIANYEEMNSCLLRNNIAVKTVPNIPDPEPTSQLPTQPQAQCFAVVGVGETRGRIRSEPSSRGGDETAITSALGEQFPVTGQQTESGSWIELKLPDGQLGWADRSVIANSEEMNSCLLRNSIDVEKIPDIPNPQPTTQLTPIPTQIPITPSPTPIVMPE